MIKTTPRQANKVKALVRKACCNCVDDNCLLLDNGYEAVTCPQLISLYGIYCKYFQTAVLPGDEKLYAELTADQRKKCKLCGRPFAAKSGNQQYCPECAEEQKRRKARERQQKRRATRSRL